MAGARFTLEAGHRALLQLEGISATYVADHQPGQQRSQPGLVAHEREAITLEQGEHRLLRGLGQQPRLLQLSVAQGQEQLGRLHGADLGRMEDAVEAHAELVHGLDATLEAGAALGREGAGGVVGSVVGGGMADEGQFHGRTLPRFSGGERPWGERVDGWRALRAGRACPAARALGARGDTRFGKGERSPLVVFRASSRMTNPYTRVYAFKRAGAVTLGKAGPGPGGVGCSRVQPSVGRRARSTGLLNGGCEGEKRGL